jgi:hypothetical protein
MGSVKERGSHCLKLLMPWFIQLVMKQSASHLWSGIGNYSSLKFHPYKLSVATIHIACHYKDSQNKVDIHISSKGKIRMLKMFILTPSRLSYFGDMDFYTAS